MACRQAIIIGNPVLNVTLKRFIVSVFSVVPEDGSAPMGEWNS
jgi:hypothetical protein